MNSITTLEKRIRENPFAIIRETPDDFIGAVLNENHLEDLQQKNNTNDEADKKKRSVFITSILASMKRIVNQNIAGSERYQYQLLKNLTAHLFSRMRSELLDSFEDQGFKLEAALAALYSSDELKILFPILLKDDWKKYGYNVPVRYAN